MLQDMIRDMVRKEVETVVKEVLAEVLGHTAQPTTQPQGKAMSMPGKSASVSGRGFQPGARVLYHVNGRISQKALNSMREADRRVFDLVAKRHGGNGISAQEIGQITGWGRKAENNIFTLRKLGAIVSRPTE